ncbi:hypothetical protein B0H34DRAFT_655506, partial [Crassisporium funariophilum]
VGLTFVHALAILSSIYRLYRRRKTRRIWWDDYVAMVAFAFDCFYFPTLWVRNVVPGVPNHQAVAHNIALTWITNISYAVIIWSTRVSLSLSIARVIPPHQSMRTASLYLVCLFGCMGVAAVIQVCISCIVIDKTWGNAYPYQCAATRNVAIFRFSCEYYKISCGTYGLNPLNLGDLTADILLVAIPFVAFWRLRLKPVTWYLLNASFAASILTAILNTCAVSVLFYVSRSHSPATRAATGYLASVLQTATSLAVCNMLVVVTSLYRFFRTEETVVAVGQAPALNVISLAATNHSQDLDLSSSMHATHTTGANLATSGSIGSFTSGQQLAERSGSRSDYHVELTELYESDLNFSHDYVDSERAQRDHRSPTTFEKLHNP